MLKSLRRKMIGDIRQNRGQFLAVWFVVMLGTAIYGAMYPAGVNLRTSFNNTYDELNYLDYQVQLDPTGADIADAAWGIPNVEAVEGRLVIESGLQINPEQDYQVALRLISLPENRGVTVNQLDIQEGRSIQSDDEMLLLQSFANHHEIEIGDTIRVWVDGNLTEKEVVGLAFSAEYIIAGRDQTSPFPTPSTFGVGWLNYGELANLTGLDGQINDIVVHAKGATTDDREAMLDAMRTDLSTTFGEAPGVAIFSRDQTASGGLVQSLLNGNFPIAIFFSGLFLGGATIITGVLLSRLVESERQRIGTMRAMGVTRRELVRHYLSFGLLIGITGGIVGSLLGYLNSFWVIATFLSTIVGGSLPGFSNMPQWDYILVGFLITTIGATVSGAYPAWRQAQTSPGVALRPPTPSTPSAISRIDLKFLPLSFRQAIRNIFRKPGRAISTALGVTTGAVMIFAAFALGDTTAIRWRELYDANDYDIRVDFSNLQNPDALEAEVMAIDGVTDAQAGLLGALSVERDNGTNFDAYGVVVPDDDSFYAPAEVDGEPFFSRNDGVWIGYNLERVLDLEIGDTITITAMGQTQEVEILGIVSHVIGTPVFIPEGLANEWAPSLSNVAYIRVENGRAEAVRESLIGLPNFLGVEIYDEFEADMEAYLLFFRTGTLIFGGFGYLLTLAVIFNTVHTSLRERFSELSILRALGIRSREIAVTVTLEQLLMLAIGLLIGIPVGQYVGFELQKAYDMDIFSQLTAMHTLSYVIGGVSLLLIVLLAEIPSLRAIEKLNLGQVSKSQSL